MKDINLETRLVAASPHSDHTNTFVKDTMQKIKTQHIKTPLWQRFAQTHRLAFAALVIAIVAMVSFTGYAYAIGSDPISLIKRWIEGDKVKIEYDGRIFEHGKSRKYSDAAITAYAEMNTVNELAFKAINAFTVPKNGVEHVDDVYSRGFYEYPILASLEDINAPSDTAAIAKKYVFGDKMNPSRKLASPAVLPTKSIQLYKKGEPATLGAEDKGTLVMLFTNKYIAHTIGTDQIKQVTVYFAFALNHTVDDFVEADKANAEGLKQASDAEQPLYEPAWGGLSTTCMNNGADVCDDEKLARGEGQGLYDEPGEYGRRQNPDAIAYGEGVATQEDQPFELLQRNLQGTIVAIDDTYITLQTSSGANWRLAYPQSYRSDFAKLWGKPLQVGDKIAGMILQSVRDLDNRTVDNTHISALVRI
jgi:hypothetical protein